METNQGYYTERLRNSAYLDILEKLNASQTKVYLIILEFGPISTEGIAKILGVYPNYVTGRVFELRKLKFIELAGCDRSETSNKQVSLWKVIKIDPQMAFNFR